MKTKIITGICLLLLGTTISAVPFSTQATHDLAMDQSNLGVSTSKQPPLPSPITGGDQLRSQHNSSLSATEVAIILQGGRVYDFEKKEWTMTPPWSGKKRENLLSSWVKTRDKTNASIPNNYLYSKK